MSIWKVCNIRNIYADHTWFHIKQQITKELIKGIVCIIEKHDTIYHYTAAYEVLLNKIYLLLTLTIIFLQEIFHNNSQTIHLY